MAEAAFTEQYSVQSSASQRPAGPPTPVSWMMGLVTCALTVGVIYWGVQLAQRDPNSLPVIRAPEGLARLEPTNPGGVQEEYTGLAVNQIQSGQTQDEEIIALAPQSGDLEESDIPALLDLENEIIEATRVDIQELNGDPVPETTELAPKTTSVDTETGAEIMMPVTAEEVDSALKEALALANSMMEGDAVPSEPAPAEAEAEVEVAANDAQEDDIAGLIVADIMSDLAAPPVEDALAEDAPAEEVAAPDAPEAEIAQEVEVAEDSAPVVAPVEGGEVASVDAGTSLIQLGAFGSRDIARTMWDTLQNRNADLLGGRSYFIQPVESGGKTLFRLRVLGFANTDEARSMCAALTERKTPCLAVVQR